MFGRYYVGNPFSFNVATPFFVWTKKYSASGSNRILHVLMSLTSDKKKWTRFLVRSKATLPKSLDPSGLPKRYLFYLKNLAESLTWWVSFSSFETLIFLSDYGFCPSRLLPDAEPLEKTHQINIVSMKILFCSDWFSRVAYCLLLLMMITLMWEMGQLI